MLSSGVFWWFLRPFSSGWFFSQLFSSQLFSWVPLPRPFCLRRLSWRWRSCSWYSRPWRRSFSCWPPFSASSSLFSSRRPLLLSNPALCSSAEAVLLEAAAFFPAVVRFFRAAAFRCVSFFVCARRFFACFSFFTRTASAARISSSVGGKTGFLRPVIKRKAYPTCVSRHSFSPRSCNTSSTGEPGTSKSR